jgi:N-acetylmuramic acid 6-phosphate etherase
MARMGRLASNWMVWVDPTNKKLVDRGTRLVAEITGVDYATACYALHETIEELARTIKPGQEKPSPVALTIARLKREKAAPTGDASATGSQPAR